MDSEKLQLCTIDVGNSNTSVAHWDGKAANDLARFANTDPASAVRAVEAVNEKIESAEHSAVVLASVKEPFGAQLAQSLCDALQREVFIIGKDLPIAGQAMLDPEAITGIDRLLASVGAFDRFGEACAVVDAGTAITIDFVDGTGVFQGGAILPGTRAWLAVLHAAAPALPELEPDKPKGDAFGKNTKDAMLNGMYYGIRGALRHLVERYAEQYAAYPRIIATGGDAQLLFDGDEFVEQIIPDLVHRGIAVCAKRALSGAESPDDAD